MIRKKIIGIYKLTSPSGKIYIGQSRDCGKREEHYRNLRIHDQPAIYNSIKKHGWITHKFEIIHECSESFLDELEKFYIIFFDTYQTKHGLNLQEGGYGGYPSEESRKKISLKSKGRIVSEETRKKISLAHKGSIKPRGHKLSKEHIEKLKQTHKGKVLSESHKANIAKGLKLSGKRIISELEKENSRKRMTGVKFSPERCANISKALKGRKVLNPKRPSEEVKKRISDTLRNHPNRLELNRLNSIKHKGKIVSEETRKKLKDHLAIKFAEQRRLEAIRKSFACHQDSKSRFRGVVFQKHANAYVVKIGFKGKQIHGGYFKDIIEAAKRYNFLALKYYGDSAKLNTIPKNDNIMLTLF